MQIKKNRHQSDELFFYTQIVSWIKKRATLVGIGAVFIVSIGFFYLGALAQAHRFIADVIRPAIKTHYRIPFHFLQGILSNPEHVSIDIKQQDYDKLVAKREEALRIGILLNTSEEYVPATIRYKDQSLKAKLRLKGDLIDHLQGEAWSFRVELKGDGTLFGMRTFSIQHPSTRRYLYEWLYHESLRREGLIALRYQFLDVTINGRSLGIYAMEEHFGKELIEHNERREGVIVRFNEDVLWKDRAQDNVIWNREFSVINSDKIWIENESNNELRDIVVAEVEPFDRKHVLADPQLLGQFRVASALLEQFRRGQLATHQVFDIDKLAKFLVLSELNGARHALFWYNLRFYYNPITSLLEPIGYNANVSEDLSGSLSIERILNFEYKGELDRSDFFSFLFADPVFFERYIQELERMSAPAYAEALFSDVQLELSRALRTVYRSSPQTYFSNEIFHHNQQFARKLLNPVESVSVRLRQTEDTMVTLEVANLIAFPVEMVSVIVDGAPPFLPKAHSVLQSKRAAIPVTYQRIDFISSQQNGKKIYPTTNFQLQYRILGQHTVRTASVIPWFVSDDDVLKNDFLRQKSTIDTFDFIRVDEAQKRITILPGIWEVRRDLIIPKGFTVSVSGGTTLNLLEGAGIVSYASLQFLGTEDMPILITSSDASGQGMALLNAQAESRFEYVVFDNLAPLHKGAYELLGAVTVHESPVRVFQSSFRNARAEDSLNIVRSDFSIENSSFVNGRSDGLDVDFGKGSIIGSVFYEFGGDGIDVSGTTVQVRRVRISGVKDKGVSVGEGSQAQLTDVTVEHCVVAVASKDTSRVDMQQGRLSSCQYGFTVYQKKPEFSGATLTASGITLEQIGVPYIIESGSTFTLEGTPISATEQNVYERLYGKK